MSTTQNRMQNSKKANSEQKEKPSGIACDYPISSAMVVFGVGVGAGMILSGLLGAPYHKSYPSLGRQTELAAGQLGRQMVDAIAGVLPASLAKHISY